MEKHLSYVVEKTSLAAYKVNILLQAYFSRETVTNDMRMDTLALLPTALRLLHVGYSIVQSFTHYLTHSFIHSFIHSLSHYLLKTHSPSLEDSFTHSLTHRV